MGKTPMTWLELINMKLSERKKAGKTASIRDVAPEAKAEWTKIKAGTHPNYIQGKAKTHSRKHKKDKTQKVDKTAKHGSDEHGSDEHSNAEINKILATLKLCGKCSKQINKLTKKQNGGGSCTSPATTGTQPQPQPTNTGTPPVSLANFTDKLAPEPAHSDTTSSLVTASTATNQTGGDCNSCSLTGGKKSKKSKKSKKNTKKNKK